MSEAGSELRQRPWYRQLWPFALMLPPAFAIAGGVAMVLLATRTPSALVVEDYARIEALTEARFGRDREAARLGLEAELDLLAGPPLRIEARLAAREPMSLPETLLLTLPHATDPDQDRQLVLRRRGDIYLAESDLRAGRYHLELAPEDASWRLAAQVAGLGGRVALRAPADGI